MFGRCQDSQQLYRDTEYSVPTEREGDREGGRKYNIATRKDDDVIRNDVIV